MVVPYLLVSGMAVSFPAFLLWPRGSRTALAFSPHPSRLWLRGVLVAPSGGPLQLWPPGGRPAGVGADLHPHLQGTQLSCPWRPWACAVTLVSQCAWELGIGPGAVVALACAAPACFCRQLLAVGLSELPVCRLPALRARGVLGACPPSQHCRQRTRSPRTGFCWGVASCFVFLLLSFFPFISGLHQVSFGAFYCLFISLEGSPVK